MIYKTVITQREIDLTAEIERLKAIIKRAAEQIDRGQVANARHTLNNKCQKRS